MSVSPPQLVQPTLLQYSEIGKLGKYLAALLERVPQSQCLSILHDDLVRPALLRGIEIVIHTNQEYFIETQVVRELHSNVCDRVHLEYAITRIGRETVAVKRQ